MIIISAIPEDAQINGGNSSYFKVTPGEHKIRILSAATIGVEWWENEEGEVQMSGGKRIEGTKPKRVKKGEAVPVTAGGGTKNFWAFPIWNHATKAIQIWSITQGSIQEALKKLDHNKDWGDLTGYDIQVERTGTGQLDTKYIITPLKPVPLDDKIKEELSVGGLPRMEALFDNEDPFAESVEFDIDSLPF